MRQRFEGRNSVHAQNLLLVVAVGLPGEVGERMNKSYRTIWNESLGAWVAASELTATRGKRNRTQRVVALGWLALALASVQMDARAATVSLGVGSPCGYSGGGAGPDGVVIVGAGSAATDGNGGISWWADAALTVTICWA